MTSLTRIDPMRNIDRFYVVQVLPTLFGDWTVLREWGRRGSPGIMRLHSHRRREEAHVDKQRTIKRRLQGGLRGYLRPLSGRKQPFRIVHPEQRYAVERVQKFDLRGYA